MEIINLKFTKGFDYYQFFIAVCLVLSKILGEMNFTYLLLHCLIFLA